LPSAAAIFVRGGATGARVEAPQADILLGDVEPCPSGSSVAQPSDWVASFIVRTILPPGAAPETSSATWLIVPSLRTLNA
jgi:hypothetical protein